MSAPGTGKAVATQLEALRLRVAGLEGELAASRRREARLGHLVGFADRHANDRRLTADERLSLIAGCPGIDGARHVRDAGILADAVFERLCEAHAALQRRAWTIAREALAVARRRGAVRDDGSVATGAIEAAIAAAVTTAQDELLGGAAAEAVAGLRDAAGGRR